MWQIERGYEVNGIFHQPNADVVYPVCLHVPMLTITIDNFGKERK